MDNEPSQDQGKQPERKTQEVVVRFSTSSILKLILLAAVVLFLYIIKDILGIVFVSIVFASALDPWIDALQKRHIHRGLAIAGIYIIMFGIFSLIIFLLIPPIIAEVKSIAQNFPSYFSNVLETLKEAEGESEQFQIAANIQKGLDSLTEGLSKITGGLFTALTSIFGGIFSLFGVLMLTFYMTVEEEGTKKFLRSISPVHIQPYLIQKINKVQIKLGAWLRGQLLLSGIIGLLSFIGLIILRVDYALVLALTAGVTEFIPYIGPFIGAVPAIFFAFNDSPMKAFLVLILYIVIQQLENQLIVPKIIQRSVGLNPMIVIIVMLIGARVGGVLGLLLAVPITTIFWVFLEDFFAEKRMRDQSLEP